LTFAASWSMARRSFGRPEPGGQFSTQAGGQVVPDRRAYGLGGMYDRSRGFKPACSTTAEVSAGCSAGTSRNELNVSRAMQDAWNLESQLSAISLPSFRQLDDCRDRDQPAPCAAEREDDPRRLAPIGAEIRRLCGMPSRDADARKRGKDPSEAGGGFACGRTRIVSAWPARPIILLTTRRMAWDDVRLRRWLGAWNCPAGVDLPPRKRAWLEPAMGPEGTGAERIISIVPSPTCPRAGGWEKGEADLTIWRGLTI